MAEPNSHKLTIREVPYFLWLFCALGVGAGLYLWLSRDMLLTGLLVIAVAMVIAIVFVPVASVTVDRHEGMLTLQRASLVRKSIQQFAISEIASVEVESRRDSEDGSTTHRLVLVLESGETVPLQSYFSSGYRGRKKKAEMLREFIGVSGQGTAPATLSQAMRQATQVAFQLQDEGVDSGVAWRVESGRFGSQAVTRWFSGDFRYPGKFLYLAQKMQGTRDYAVGPGLIGSASRLLYQQSLKLYGFKSDHTPGLEAARSLEPEVARLGDHYVTLASDPDDARRLLDPWVVNALEQWADRYPMKRNVEGEPDSFNQLVVLICPLGVYLARLGELTPALMRELADLGIQIARVLPVLG